MTGEVHAQAYRYGSDLALEVTAPDEAGCLTGAVRALAAAVASVADHIPRRTDPVQVAGDQPVDRLVALLDEVIARLDADGQLAVDLRMPTTDANRVHGELALVDLDTLDTTGPAPKAATWHRIAIGPRDGGWYATAVIDL